MGRINSIGPADDDPGLSFELDTVSYRNGVSAEMGSAEPPLVVPLKAIHVGHEVYFEGNVDASRQWNWVKRRFNQIVDSGEIGGL